MWHILFKFCLTWRGKQFIDSSCFISTSFQLVNRKTFIDSCEAIQNDVSFYSSVLVSRQCLFFRDKVTVFLIYTWFEHMTSQGEMKQKSLHFFDERLSLVCFHFTLFILRLFTLWNKFQNLYFNLSFFSAAVLSLYCKIDRASFKDIHEYRLSINKAIQKSSNGFYKS